MLKVKVTDKQGCCPLDIINNKGTGIAYMSNVYLVWFSYSIFRGYQSADPWVLSENVKLCEFLSGFNHSRQMYLIHDLV